MSGWVKIHRTVSEHYLWQDKPFSKGQAWIDILLMVNHEDNKTMIGNELVLVKKGSRVTSEIKLSDRWGWSRKKVRVFLKGLEEDKMLVKKSTTKYTMLTVVNWGLHQDKGTTKEQQKNSEGTTEEQQRNTNKNEKNVKNEKKKDISAINAFFEMIWKPYPEKKGKSKITDKQKKVLYDLGEVVIMKCLKRYKKDKPDWQAWQNGATFFRSGYVDYLDENYLKESVKAEPKEIEIDWGDEEEVEEEVVPVQEEIPF